MSTKRTRHVSHSRLHWYQDPILDLRSCLASAQNYQLWAMRVELEPARVLPVDVFRVSPCCGTVSLQPSQAPHTPLPLLSFGPPTHRPFQPYRGGNILYNYYSDLEPEAINRPSQHPVAGSESSILLRLFGKGIFFTTGIV